MKSVSWVLRLACNIHTAFIPNRKVHRTTAFFISAWGSKKKHRKVKLQLTLDKMADPRIEEILAPLRASVKEQASFVSLYHTVLGLNNRNESLYVLDFFDSNRGYYDKCSSGMCLCGAVEIHQRYRVTFCLYIQAQVVIQANRPFCLLGVLFNPANRGNEFLRNFSELLLGHMVSQPPPPKKKTR
jgi:hypothetical protein